MLAVDVVGVGRDETGVELLGSEGRAWHRVRDCFVWKGRSGVGVGVGDGGANIGFEALRGSRCGSG